jgi:glycosyltransferase involved in cell wall biosynthesis
VIELARRLSVLLTTEGTYPYHKGGVSTWCHSLTKRLSDVDFTILALVMHPFLERRYELAPNVRQLITVPLWGTEDPAEYGWHDSMSEFLGRRWQTTSEHVERSFVPVYERFLREAASGCPRSVVLADAVNSLHEHFERYDYHRTMTDRAVWEAFVRVATVAWSREDPPTGAPSLGELAEAWRLVYRLLTVLAAPIPRTDLTHAAAAAFCGLPCVIAKLRRGTPYLLTEHGVYLREQYLNLSRSIRSFFVRWFLLRMMSAVADLNYAFADQLLPVCRYNTRWERWRGVERGRIRVIYNGVDPVRFSPAAEASARRDRPLVVNVGLIYPLKGQLDLIEATALVRRTVPNVQVRLYGSPSDRDYYARCQARVRELGLDGAVTFEGSTNEPWEVYRRADVVVVASISEAFPYSVVESMLCGAAIVATDVGGVSEALGSAGVLVNAHDPAGLASAIGRLLESPRARRSLGEAARARALRHFTEDEFVEQYRVSYQRLVDPTQASQAGHPQSGNLTV